MRDCQDIEPLLSAYLDDELTQQDRQQIELHVESCSTCRHVLDDLVRIRKGLEALSTPEPSEVQWRIMMSVTASKTSRGLGWLLGIIGVVVLTGYGAYQFATDDTINAFKKLSIAAVAVGAVLLLVSVLIDRMRARRSDKYKDVEI